MTVFNLWSADNERRDFGGRLVDEVGRYPVLSTIKGWCALNRTACALWGMRLSSKLRLSKARGLGGL